jgi:hypothetical protein
MLLLRPNLQKMPHLSLKKHFSTIIYLDLVSKTMELKGHLAGWLLSAVVSGGVVAVTAPVVEAGYVNSRSTCVNLRTQPFVGAGVISCLNRGTYLEVRRYNSGEYIYREDGSGRGWFNVYIPSIGRSGWMAAEFVVP